MLELTIKSVEFFDERDMTFGMSKSQLLVLEHSLISVSKWESKWHKPFLTRLDKTKEETEYYIRCMVINKNIDLDSYKFMSNSDYNMIDEYIGNSMTATRLPKDDSGSNSEVITSELMYFWMINYSIPFECEKWHLNRLLTLINVCSVKNKPPKKTNTSELLAKRRALNEQRLKEHNSHG